MPTTQTGKPGRELQCVHGPGRPEGSKGLSERVQVLCLKPAPGTRLSLLNSNAHLLSRAGAPLPLSRCDTHGSSGLALSLCADGHCVTAGLPGMGTSYGLTLLAWFLLNSLKKGGFGRSEVFDQLLEPRSDMPVDTAASDVPFLWMG